MTKPKDSKRIEIQRMKELMGDCTQTRFSELTGISQSSISKILNNQHSLTANNIVAIAEAYNVSTDWLLGLSDEKHPQTIISEPKLDAFTYGDIFNVFSKLIHENGITMFQDNFTDVNGVTHCLTEVGILQVNDKILKRMLYENTTTMNLVDDVYQSWFDSRYTEYDKVPYISYDETIDLLFKSFFGSGNVSPQKLAQFHEEILEIFKKINQEK